MYEGTLNVLKKINLELEKGEKVAWVGESGSGCLLYTSDAADEE